MDLAIEDAITQVFPPLLHENRLIITFLDQNSDYRITVVDTETKTILKTLNFEDAVPSIFVNERGEVVMLVGRDSNRFDVLISDPRTFEIIETKDFSLKSFFSPGPLQAYMVDDKFFYSNTLAQPSTVPFGVAIYDFIKQENAIVDMVGVVGEAREKLQINIDLTVYGFSPEADTFFVGFRDASKIGVFEGGIMVISNTGKLIDVLELPFVPSYFINE